MNNECMQRCNEEIEEVGDEETKGDDDQRSSSTAKKRVRRGALMEGSRCSRVNGRGWRCCQQTLVGYSLCEHHLGKGRLRSMTSVRSRSMAKTSTTKRETQPLLSSTLPLPGEEAKGISFGDKVIDSVNGDAEVIKKPLMTSKKKQKLGMAKARSINSLLGQSKNGTEASQTRWGFFLILVWKFRLEVVLQRFSTICNFISAWHCIMNVSKYGWFAIFLCFLLLVRTYVVNLYYCPHVQVE